MTAVQVAGLWGLIIILVVLVGMWATVTGRYELSDWLQAACGFYLAATVLVGFALMVIFGGKR